MFVQSSKHEDSKQSHTLEWVMRGGCCAAAVLVVLAALSARQFSRTDVSAGCAQCAEREKQLARIRAALNQAVNATRDLLLDRSEQRIANFEEQLARCRADATDAVAQLAKDPFIGSLSGQLRVSQDDFWKFLAETKSWTPTARVENSYAFLTQAVPRHRQPVQRPIRQLTDANNAELHRAESEIAQRRQTLYRQSIAALAAAVTLLSMVILLGVAHACELKRTDRIKLEELKKAHYDLGQLSALLLKVQEEERRSLSRELHDSIGQVLTALRMEISHVHSHEDDPMVRGRLKRARSLAEEAIRSVRDVATLIRPTTLDLGLEAALAWQAEDFQRRTTISCEFHASELPPSLPDAWNTCIYRVVQEALHNCEKHAAASKVHITLTGSAGLVLHVEDDGCGFETDNAGAPPRTGLGLLGMRERAAMLGGSFVIHSARGRGTKVTMKLPLPPLSDKAAVKLPEKKSYAANSHSAG